MAKRGEVEGEGGGLPEHGCRCPDGTLGPCQSEGGPCAGPRAPAGDEDGHDEHGHDEHDHGDHEHDHEEHDAAHVHRHREKVSTHGHAHSHLLGGHAHGERIKDRKRLLGTLVLTASMMVAEAVGGWLSGSLALLSDAGHMLTDAAALLLAMLALWFAGRPADLRRTYGFFRLEVLSAFINGLTLIGIAVLIGVEAIERIAHPAPIRAGLMLVVAVAGLLVNLGGMALLSHSKSMNVRGAFLHVLGDALSSVGVIVAAAVAWFTGWTILDPLISVAIALVIAIGALGLIRQATHVLIEGVPEHIDLAEVFGAMKRLEGVNSVHDLHVWTIAHNMHALSAHLVIGAPSRDIDHDRVLLSAREMLRERFGIDHATLQVESEDFAKRHLH